MISGNKIDVVSGKVVNANSLIDLEGKDIIFRNDQTQKPEFRIGFEDGLFTAQAFCEKDNCWKESKRQRAQQPQSSVFPKYSSRDFLSITPAAFDVVMGGKQKLHVEDGALSVAASNITLDSEKSTNIFCNVGQGLGISDHINKKNHIWIDPTQVHIFGKQLTGLNAAADPSAAVTLQQIQDLQCDSVTISGDGEKKLIADKNGARYLKRPDIFTDSTLVDAQFVREMISQVQTYRRHGAESRFFRATDQVIEAKTKLAYDNPPIICRNTDIVHKKFVTDTTAAKNHTHQARDILDLVSTVKQLNFCDLQSPATDVNFNQMRLINLGKPTQSTDAATKDYVDSSVAPRKEIYAFCEQPSTNESEFIQAQWKICQLSPSGQPRETAKISLEKGTYKLSMKLALKQQEVSKSNLAVSFRCVTTGNAVIPACRLFDNKWTVTESAGITTADAFAIFFVEADSECSLFCDRITGVDFIDFVGLLFTKY